MSHPGTLTVALLLAACASPRTSQQSSASPSDTQAARPSSHPPQSETAAPAPLAPTLLDADWRALSSRPFGFRIPLPDAAGWVRRETPKRWWSLEHAATNSKLRLRSWRAERRVKKEQCREQIYLWQGDLRLSAEPVLETQLERPLGFDVQLVADVRTGEGAGLTLVAVAFGAAVGRCYAAVLETHAEGGGADAELGRRLRLLVDGALNQVEILGLEDVPLQRQRP